MPSAPGDQVSAQAQTDLELLRRDFPFYAKRALRIRTKTGSILPLDTNRAQQYVHEALERQRLDTGRVRAIILKARQEGISTYVQARFYWLVTGQWGKRAYILTHEQPATDNLFEMVARFHEHCPSVLRPSTKNQSAKEIYFDRLDSGYKVGTAGSKGTGRSSTIQYFHGSEVAFWPNAETHMAGIGQAMPDIPGTEIILESTANGTNLFRRMWQAASSGESEYLPIFIPWFWMPEYRRSPPADFVATSEERKEASLYGLDDAQLYWRRMKIMNDFQGDADVFKQEYPACPEEAFLAAIHGAIYAKELAAARETNRIGRVPYDPALPVHTIWDIGVGDPTAIWFVQMLGLEARIIDYYAASGEGLPHYAKVLQDRGYVYGRHIGPHDIAVRELGSGRSRIEVAASLGIKFEIAPNVPLEDGIHAARMWMARCWFDEEKCRAGLEGLQHYRWDYNKQLDELKSSPVHDWASHPSDAYRYAALALKDKPQVKSAQQHRQNLGGSQGWMK